MQPTFLDKTVMRPFVFLTPRWVRPNYLTTVRLLLVPIIFYLLINDHYRLGAVIFIFAVFTDAWDGAIARTRNMITQFGKIFDPIADKLIIISTGAVLLTKYMPIWIFQCIFLLEVIIVISALFSKFMTNKDIKANSFGKIKMVFQSVGISLIFIYAGFLNYSLILSISMYFLSFAIIFALLSLWYDGGAI
jgi:cardiolipin synthase